MRFKSQNTILACSALVFALSSCSKKSGSAPTPVQPKSKDGISSQGKIKDGRAIFSFNLPPDSLDDYKCRVGIKRGGVDSTSEYTACPPSLSYDIDLAAQSVEPGDTIIFSAIDETGAEVTSTHIPVQSAPPPVPPVPMDLLPQVEEPVNQTFELDEVRLVNSLDYRLFFQARTTSQGNRQRAELTAVTKSAVAIPGIVSEIFTKAIAQEASVKETGFIEYSAPLVEVQAKEDTAEFSDGQIQRSLVARNTVRLAKISADGTSKSILNIMSNSNGTDEELKRSTNLFGKLCSGLGDEFRASVPSQAILDYALSRKSADPATQSAMTLEASAIQEYLNSDKVAENDPRQNNRFRNIGFGQNDIAKEKTNEKTVYSCIVNDSILVTSFKLQSGRNVVTVDKVEEISQIEDAEILHLVGLLSSTNSQTKKQYYTQEMLLNRSAALVGDVARMIQKKQ